MSEDAPTPPPGASYTSTATTSTSSAAATTGQSTLRRAPSVTSSHWSAADTPQHHYQGTSYFPHPARATSPSRPRRRPDIVRSMSATSQRRARSSSASSSPATPRVYRDNSNLLTEEDDDNDNDSITPTERLSRGKGLASVHDGDDDDDDDDNGDDSSERDADGSDREDDDPITVKDRQSLINVEHPFGLPIWKPALYKKSRSVTRHADAALHSQPSAQAGRHLYPGNIFWLVCFGWWLALASFAVSIVLRLVPMGGKQYSNLAYGLGWYVAWPFGKYVEGSGFGGDLESRGTQADDPAGQPSQAPTTPQAGRWQSPPSTTRPRGAASERTALLEPVDEHVATLPWKSYGATASPGSISPDDKPHRDDWLGRGFFWFLFSICIAPLMLFACITCWAFIFTIPMAKLNWALIQYIFSGPDKIRFCAAPPVVVVPSREASGSTIGPDGDSTPAQPEYAVKHPRLAEGQLAPSMDGPPTSRVLLCVYRAMGWQYYKYTVGGVNIIFVNLMPLVFFVIFDGFVLLPLVDHREAAGKHVNSFLAFLASRALIFIMSLASVIPLSYFIGMAVASISAQSSIGMGAVINASFGSIIEIILYAIALTQGKGHLVEGSIVGSLLAGVLLMPGLSMCASAVRRKEQRFNAKSAGVTSMMLIMAFIGTLTPTLFYQTYGNFELICDKCPDGPSSQWKCNQCYYQHPDPVEDPFYQSTVKQLMYFCAIILVFSYLVGLWFSLRTHATQIWQNPQQLLQQPLELPSNRLSVYQRLLQPGQGQGPASQASHPRSLRHKRSNVTSAADSDFPSRSATPTPRAPDVQVSFTDRRPAPPSPTLTRRVSHAPQVAPSQQQGMTPLLESVDFAMKNNNLHPTQLPESMTTDDFTRAVAVATVSALRHQQTLQGPARLRAAAAGAEADTGGHGGHEAPEWSRGTSAAVLLSCTALYAIIAELLVDVVDVVLQGSGIDEKFLGITLFALVPNTTEFMNAVSFALNGNIALSVEIGSAYALQVCLLQIPAMVAFSAWYAPEKMGAVAYTFTLVFPRWDVIVIILSVFLMTYTYIEARSNYHRGSILILSYLVLVSGFYFAPRVADDAEPVDWRSTITALKYFFVSP
ncbi:hypothetical protein CONPUDRAFT_56471 [Coniophora puteana RWD-64-598 SS2]|uniref:Calcium permease n=1 Tax=Coniophora puteana (strain RWD-64-598) TaxID=741705 RepID=A0A5M3MRB8_CONPW|nr:uncharacterized protein CONPUDRAFT_56471 [Coniophora puteana RWD-64-598 SS2]EIW81284.1 hypothetical protein CONPUDRAFT_56471 [Coniophora puteana RWD-64-598 SS2]